MQTYQSELQASMERLRKAIEHFVSELGKAVRQAVEFFIKTTKPFWDIKSNTWRKMHGLPLIRKKPRWMLRHARSSI